MTCRFCVVTVPEGRNVCHFHARSLALAAEARCIWCTRDRRQTDFPTDRSAYCSSCLASRIRQGGDRHRLANAIWRRTAA